MKYPYEYLLHFWGGGLQELKLEDKYTYQWFKTKKERDKELNRLRELIKTCKNQGYAHCIKEGELTRHNFIIKSLIFYRDNYYWVYNKLGYGFFTKKELEENDQEYMLDWKWGICPPNDIEGNEIDLDSNECHLLNTSLIIEEPK